jgi:hypothetical protein
MGVIQHHRAPVMSSCRAEIRSGGRSLRGLDLERLLGGDERPQALVLPAAGGAAVEAPEIARSVSAPAISSST